MNIVHLSFSLHLLQFLSSVSCSFWCLGISSVVVDFNVSLPEVGNLN